MYNILATNPPTNQTSIFSPHFTGLTMRMRRLKRNKRRIIGSNGKAAAVILGYCHQAEGCKG